MKAKARRSTGRRRGASWRGGPVQRGIHPGRHRDPEEREDVGAARRRMVRASARDSRLLVPLCLLWWPFLPGFPEKRRGRPSRAFRPPRRGAPREVPREIRRARKPGVGDGGQQRLDALRRHRRLQAGGMAAAAPFSSGLTIGHRAAPGSVGTDRAAADRAEQHGGHGGRAPGDVSQMVGEGPGRPPGRRWCACESARTGSWAIPG